MVNAAVGRLRGLSRYGDGALLIALSLALIGGTMVETLVSDLSVVLLGIGTLVLVVGCLRMDSSWQARTGVVVASFASFGMMVHFLVRFSGPWSDVRAVFIAMFIAAVAGVLALTIRHGHRLLVGGIAVLAIGFVLMQSVEFAHLDPLKIDVYELHEQAADALRVGENPYTTGNVQVVETNQMENPEVIYEYTYPPAALVAYAGSSIVFGDSRMAGAIAIPAAFALVLWFVSRRWPATDRDDHIAVAVVALLVMNPMNFLIVYVGWTEAIALPFLVLAAGLWTKRPFLSAVMLGLAFASKQYFIVAVPLLFFLPDPNRWKRAGVAGVTALFTYVPFLLWDAGGLVDGVVRHHLTRAPRPDSATLAGIGIHVPTAISVLIAVGVGIMIARRAQSSGMVLLAVSSTIGTFTYLSVRGFRNSWWLVVALASVAIGFLDGQSDTVPPLTSMRSGRPVAEGPT